MFHAGMATASQAVSAVTRAGTQGRRERLPLPFGGLVRMRRSWLVRILTRFARTLGRFDRVVVVPDFGRGPCRRLLLLLDHDRDPNALPSNDEPTGNR
jgi:hypothetical protein